MKENLKPYVYKLWKYDVKHVRPRTFCRTVRRVTLAGKVKFLRNGAEVKASVNSTLKVEPRTFCRTVRRVTDTGKVKDLRSGAEGKPSLNRAFSQSE